jgi:hypothetical protein
MLSRWSIWSVLSSGMWLHGVQQNFANVTEVCSTSIIIVQSVLSKQRKRNMFFISYWLLGWLISAPWRWRHWVPPKCQRMSTRLYAVTSPQTVAYSSHSTVMRTSNWHMHTNARFIKIWPLNVVSLFLKFSYFPVFQLNRMRNSKFFILKKSHIYKNGLGNAHPVLCTLKKLPRMSTYSIYYHKNITVNLATK